MAEQGSLGDLAFSEVPEPMRNAVRQYLATLGAEGLHRSGFTTAAVLHFGWGGHPRQVADHTLMYGTADEFVDLLEILIEFGTYKARSGIERQINALAERHRFGFRFDDGEARMIGSPALSDEVIGPALLAVQRPGWEEAERRYREALDHQRGGASENDDALTAANAALEAALIAGGLKGDRLSALAKDLRSKQLVPSELAGVPEALDTLLKRSGAIRDNHSDAHGRPAGTDEVPQALVNLAIHLTGAFIVFLAEETG